MSMRRFSTTQLTVIILAAMLCVAAPATTVAAGIAKVQVAGGNGKTAKVSDGRLAVNAEVNGTVKTSQQGSVTVDVPGTVSTSQQGPVVSRPAPPSAFRTWYAQNFGSGLCAALATAPAGQGLVITQVRVDLTQRTGSDAFVGVYVSTGACAQPVASVLPPAVGNYVVNFEPGLVVPPGSKVVIGGASFVANVGASGYEVPADELVP